MDEEELLKEINKAHQCNLSSLLLPYKEITTLPPEIGKLTNLQKLDISNNQLTHLPSEIGKLTGLKELAISRNRLESLPPEIGKLTNLQSLAINNNQLTLLPPEIGNLTKLQTLFIHNNQLIQLPPEIGKLTKLQTLFIRINQLTHLPPEIKKLTNLQKLHIHNNQLNQLPSEIGKLTKLKELAISDNQLTHLPPEIANLTKVTYFDVQKNPLLIPPIEIATKGIDAIKEYFALLKEQETKKTKSKEQKPEITELYEAKLLIVGQGGVGKTSILKRLIDDTFSETQESTEGIEIKPLTLKTQNNIVIKLNVWDFGGQEIYHATHQFFLTKRSVYMLVWDARQEDEFGRIEHWLNTIKVFGEGSPVILVLNKYDEYAGDINLKDLKDKFPDIIQGFYRVSCKEPDKGYDSFDKLKANIAEIAADLSHMGTPWPEPWIKIRKQFENDSRKQIDYLEFQTVCKNNGIEERGEKVLDEYLHDLGVFLHFKDDLTLRNTIIIKPSWGTNAVYKIVSSRAVLERKGILQEKDLPEIWKDLNVYPQSKYATLLSLMKNFELSFQMDDTKNHVIASALTKESVDADYDLSIGTKIIYEYEFLPKSVIPRFIVRAHKLIKRDNENNYLCWRNGTILEKISDGLKTNAYIKADPVAQKVEITVSGDNKRELIGVIREHFDRIHEKTKGINPKLIIPCNCEKNCTETYDYSYLIKAENKGKTIVECRKSVTTVLIKNLFEQIRDISYDVFISYSSVDKSSISKKLLHHLKKRGISYWIDHEQIIYGERTINNIEYGLRNSKHMLVCMSKSSVKSNWVQAEYGATLRKNIKNPTGKKVFILMLEDCDEKDIPELLYDIKRANYSDKKSFEELLDILSKQ
ncbi:MAG: TIR domain-containing protein [Nitrospirae bacterium]|nr:TIR domain-containing protein [Nitrospirota bacterium]MBF0535701.1 TIR domain-containing protein [Nitrospirota bacterium]MBF0617526.1 TIR domain-containing protein [Nitrospirota bacterium]